MTPFIRSLTRRYCRDPDARRGRGAGRTAYRASHSPHLGSRAARSARGWPRSPPGAASTGSGVIRASRGSKSAMRRRYETFAAPAANHESGALRAPEAIEPLLAALPERQRLALEAVKIRGSFGGRGGPRIGSVGRRRSRSTCTGRSRRCGGWSLRTNRGTSSELKPP